MLTLNTEFLLENETKYSVYFNILKNLQGNISTTLKGILRLVKSLSGSKSY